MAAKIIIHVKVANLACVSAVTLKCSSAKAFPFLNKIEKKINESVDIHLIPTKKY